MKELKQYFEGTGEAKGFLFHQIARTKDAYIYEVTPVASKRPHYEVFKRRINTRFETVTYPKAQMFGLWAWTYPTYKMARQKLEDISQDENTQNLSPISGVFAHEI